MRFKAFRYLWGKSKEYQGFVFLLTGIILVWSLFNEGFHPDPKIVPSFWSIVRYLFSLVGEGVITYHLKFTLYLSFIGFFIATILGIVAGILVGRYRRLGEIFEPLIYLSFPVPKIVFVGLFVVWFGLRDKMKIFMVVIACFFPVAINTIAGARNVNPNFIKVARDLGVKEWELLKDVIFPSSLPAIYAGMRIAVGLALIVTIALEMIINPDQRGLGWLMADAIATRNISLAFVGAIMAGVLGVVFHIMIKALETKTMPWLVQKEPR